MNSNFDAIVLKVTPHKENDLILSLLSSSAGRIDALVRGVKKSRRSVLFCEPFSYSNFDLYRGRSQGLFIVDSAEPIEPFYELRQNLLALSVAQYFAEICMGLPKESASGDEEKFLKLLLNSLYILCKKPEISVSTVKMVFELKFAKFQGLAPDFSACSNCQKPEGNIWIFDQGIYCNDCAKGKYGHKINEAIRKIILHISETENLSAYGIFSDEKILDYIGNMVEKYFCHITEKSYFALDYYKQVKDLEILAKGIAKNERNKDT